MKMVKSRFDYRILMGIVFLGTAVAVPNSLAGSNRKNAPRAAITKPGTAVAEHKASNKVLSAKVFSAFESVGLQPLEKNTVKPTAGRGKTIIQFWASWCVGCKANMETTMTTLKSSKMAAGSANYVTVSLDENPIMATRYLEKAGPLTKELRSRTFVDTQQKMAESLGITSVPAMLLINADGSIAATRVGHIDAATIRKFLGPAH